jgi:hypothetical protein
MNSLAKALTGLAALAFALAVVAHYVGSFLGTMPEAFSRASTNLALLAIALGIVFGDRGASSGRPGMPL